ncbi:chromosome segregation in meiosis-related protein [Cytospora paraplurivora]|uniref:Chromosome segregation in meiosis protein n=1 Tax=Cytospora paraplurivora TaxID=2898453 RepID=A0AAN9YEK6_9PEZI
MPSKTDPRNAQTTNFDDIDNYFLQGDLDDDPFASPEPADRAESGATKRKEPGDGLGIDEEVSVAKKARVPRIKLDQERLVSQKGIPALRKRARDLKLKGKGHEWGDASRLMSFYQEWLDDLFPKAKFLDALAMVEKAGHHKMMQKMRLDWINEGRPRDATTTVTIEDEEGVQRQHQQSDEFGAMRQAERVAPIFEKAAASGSRLRTPEVNDLFGDDIYNATPVRAAKHFYTSGKAGEPDEVELNALLEQTEGSPLVAPAKPKGSMFGNGKPKTADEPRRAEPDEDDLDALLAEAEAQGSSKQTMGAAAGDIAKPSKTGTNDAAGGDEDDLDELMAEVQAQTTPEQFPGAVGRGPDPAASEWNDDEEAMAEMDGLW